MIWPQQKKILDRLKKISGKDEENETYLTAPEINKFYWPIVLDWVKEKKNKKIGHYKNIESVFKKPGKDGLTKSREELDKDSSVSAWRAATMGRLSELNLVQWRIGDKDSGHSGISKFCLKKSKK